MFIQHIKQIKNLFMSFLTSRTKHTNRYHLYVYNSSKNPSAHYKNEEKALAAAMRDHPNTHCRIVDKETGNAKVINALSSALKPKSFNNCIEIDAHITARPQFMLDLHRQYPQLTMATECWRNCFITIELLSKKHPDLQYALALVETQREGIVGHALIEHKGKFYDPTLEVQPKLWKSGKYRLLEVISRETLVAMLNSRHGPDWLHRMREGNLEWSIFRVEDNGVRAFDL